MDPTAGPYPSPVPLLLVTGWSTTEEIGTKNPCRPVETIAARLACSPVPACIGKTVRAAPSSSSDRVPPAARRTSEGRPQPHEQLRLAPSFLLREVEAEGGAEQQGTWLTAQRLGSVLAVCSDVLANKAAPPCRCTGPWMRPVFVGNLD